MVGHDDSLPAVDAGNFDLDPSLYLELVRVGCYIYQERTEERKGKRYNTACICGIHQSYYCPRQPAIGFNLQPTYIISTCAVVISLHPASAITLHIGQGKTLPQASIATHTHHRGLSPLTWGGGGK